MAAHTRHSLRGSMDEDEENLSSSTSHASLALAASPPQKPWVLLVSLALFLVAIVDMGAFLAEPPRTRIFEANLCLSYYREHDVSVIGADGSIPETLCKIDAVQQKLAMIFGWQDLFDALPGMVLAVPFGTLADRVGRKWIFTASLFGLQLSSAWTLLICYFKTLPLQLTWFSSAFFLLGGGPLVAVAIVMAMLADIVPPERRTTIFLYLTSSVLVAEMLAPVMAARLMEKSDWLPLLLALGIQQLGICIAFFFPETLHLRDLPEPKVGGAEAIELKPLPPKGGYFTLKAQMHNFHVVYKFLRSDWTLGLVVFTFMASRLGRQAITLLVRYASKRYGWEIKKAAYLLSLRAATNLAAVAVFLPLMNWYLLKRLRMPAHWADLWIARGSIILTTVAFFIMGIAAYPALLVLGLLVYNMGSGYSAAMRSVAIHVVGGQSSPDVGKLMSSIAVVESIGVMIAGPLFSQLFQWGMDLGEFWLGLPYLASVLVLGMMTMVTFAISVRDQETGYMEVQTEDGDLGDELGRSSAIDDSTSTVHRRPPSVTEAFDQYVSQQHALAAALVAFNRAQAHEAVQQGKKPSSEMSRSKSNASRKSLTSQGQGSHFPPHDTSFRSSQPQKTIQSQTKQRQSRSSTINTEKFPPFFPDPNPNLERPLSAPRPLSTQPSIAFSEYSRPSTQPKAGRQSASSSITSQQIRKARSMYYASSVQTGSPIARPPAKYLTTPPPIAISPVPDIPVTVARPRSLGPSPLTEPGPRLPVTVAMDESVDKARDKYLQSFQQRSIKHKPSLFMAPFMKRQDRSKDKSKRLSSGLTTSPAVGSQAPDESTDMVSNEFMPGTDKKDKRSFSGSLKSKFKRVFRRTSNKSPSLPVQQIDASREYFANPPLDVQHTSDGYVIPSPEEEMLQRVRDTAAQRALKRLTVIHEAKDSIGSETDPIVSSFMKRKSLPPGALAAFREPMPMQSLLEETSDPVDPKRVFSALMKEIGASKYPAPASHQSERTPGAESDVFESSITKGLHSDGRDLHSSTSKDFRPSIGHDQRPPSRRAPSAATESSQGKASSLRTLGRAIRSTIRTVTPGEHRSSPCPEPSDGARSEFDLPNVGSESSPSPEVHDLDEDCVRIDSGISCAAQPNPIFSPSVAQTEKRVERAKNRWKTPLEDGEKLQFPRETDRTYNVANFTQNDTTDDPRNTLDQQIQIIRTDVPSSPAPRPLMSPLSPSIYSRNTDGASILPNDSVVSFNGTNGLERHHNGGSAVILTSQSVRSYIVGTPSPKRPDSIRSSRDWKAWLSHEVSSMEFTSKEDLKLDESYTPRSSRMNDRFPYINTGRRSSNNSARSSRLSRSSPDSLTSSSLKSAKGTPSPRIYSDLSVPSIGRSSRSVTQEASKWNTVLSQSKENITPPLTSGIKTRRPNISPLGLSPRLNSLQPLSSAALNRSSTNMNQYTSNVSRKERSKHKMSPTADPLRPRVRVTLRPVSPDKPARRPKSAFDLRGTNYSLPRPASDIRRPALQLKPSTSSLALTKEPSPGTEDRVIDSVIEDGERSGSVTPGQRMADRFLRERKSTGVLEGKHRGGLRLVREDTPAFL
ncbi:hypothetical protein FB567DRAFT_490630 [Paraphoma chrysanthemicola]|uniref:Major facilitator superfamily (MFS) profile domain-containing protein n=1 Tax=Paraphoma chrysanthemicola TaxID=798071 RepID=A0A8K0REY3_9PLEO|nr:hypothetical protein FB567DRAFT_490630 [Paraphoma chrysanthemicola]